MITPSSYLQSCLTKIDSEFTWFYDYSFYWYSINHVCHFLNSNIIHEWRGTVVEVLAQYNFEFIFVKSWRICHRGRFINKILILDWYMNILAVPATNDLLFFQNNGVSVPACNTSHRAYSVPTKGCRICIIRSEMELPSIIIVTCSCKQTWYKYRGNLWLSQNSVLPFISQLPKYTVLSNMKVL